MLAVPALAVLAACASTAPNPSLPDPERAGRASLGGAPVEIPAVPEPGPSAPRDSDSGLSIIFAEMQKRSVLGTVTCDDLRMLRELCSDAHARCGPWASTELAKRSCAPAAAPE